MNFLTIAIIGYFLLSAESVLSKALLIGKLKSWQLYVFYVGIFSAFSFIFTPFGLIWPGWNTFWLSLGSGIVFIYSLGFLFSALYKSAATRVYVLYGSILAITTFLLSEVLINRILTNIQISGLSLLLLGGFFISCKFHKRKLFSSWKKILASGILAGISLVILKTAYERQNFVSGYIYSRAGIMVGTFTLFAWTSFRKAVINGLRRGNKKNLGDLVSVIGVKTLAGLGTIAIQYAIFLGNVTIVNALVSVQYLFTFLLSTLLSIRYKKIFQEELFVSNFLFKFIGVILVVAGVFLASL